MRRRPYIPSRARTMRPVERPEPTDAERIAALEERIAWYQSAESWSERERKRLAALLWERYRDEEFRPMTDAEARARTVGT